MNTYFLRPDSSAVGFLEMSSTDPCLKEVRAMVMKCRGPQLIQSVHTLPGRLADCGWAKYDLFQCRFRQARNK